MYRIGAGRDALLVPSKHPCAFWVDSIDRSINQSIKKLLVDIQNSGREVSYILHSHSTAICSMLSIYSLLSRVVHRYPYEHAMKSDVVKYPRTRPSGDCLQERSNNERHQRRRLKVTDATRSLSPRGWAFG